ncbi:MAG: ATP phosphoribosyltransferase regulatory subunit [archaeon]
MNTENVKGFKEFTGEDAEKRAEIKKILVETFERYGFEPAETPLVEYEEFVRGENPNDEAVRDTFKLKDRGKRKLALRYEFTFQLRRIAKNKKLPYKRYQIGELFRDEPIREGRTRQFTQCDIDVIGSTFKDEAECLAAFNELFKKLDVEVNIYVNNRKLLNEILEKEKINLSDRNNVLRELDKLDKLGEKEVEQNLKKYGAEKLLKIFKQKEDYFKKYTSYSEIEKLKKYCELFKVKAEFRPFLVRGLSYYNGSVFEVWSKKLKVSVCGGGSYLIDGIQSTGISLGLEPLMLIENLKSEKEKYLVVSLGEEREAVRLAQQLRKKGKNTSVYYGKPSKALEYANSCGIDKVVFVGEEEVKNKKFKVKNMKTGKESMLKI